MECGNCLRVGVRPKTLSWRGSACLPFLLGEHQGNKGKEGQGRQHTAGYGFGEFQTPSSVSLLALTEYRGRELSECLSAYYLCSKVNSPSSFFSQNSLRLVQNSVSWFSPPKQYRSIQHDFRQRHFLRAIASNHRYRIVLPEELISITETDLWEHCRESLAIQIQIHPSIQINFHYRYRLWARNELISATISATAVFRTCFLPQGPCHSKNATVI